LVLANPLGVHVRGVEVPPFFGAVAPRGIGGAGEARRLLFAEPEGPVALEALPDVMTTEQQLLWFGGLAGAARLGWKAPHFQSRKLTERLGRVAVPTLVIWGRRDLLVPAEAAQVWEGSIPGARLLEVPGAGHCLALERPEVAAEVEGFLLGPG
jgi:pimeloyl-ACP methyl ester carboxylesterase